MEHSKQVHILSELLRQIETKKVCDAGRVVRMPMSDYARDDLAAEERQTLFRRHPQMLGLSSELPNPGSFLTNNDLGVPILATRDKTGRFRAFLNSCRHRGAQVTSVERGEQSRFTCPYHAWTYGSDGALISVRENANFGELDKACNGLIELPSAEKYGILIVHPDRDGILDVDALLGTELAAEIESWDFGRAVFLGESVFDVPLNWKLANDTYGEAYHFSVLHKSTVANVIHGDASHYEEFGRNHRMTNPTQYIHNMRHTPQESWNLMAGTSHAYHFFPNVNAIFNGGILSFIKIYPDLQKTNRSRTRVSFYSVDHMMPKVVETAGERHTEDNLYQPDLSKPIAFDLGALQEMFRSTVEGEDYWVAAQQQISADSGMIDECKFGRNEPGLHHFHSSFRDALGREPLEEYRPAMSDADVGAK